MRIAGTKPQRERMNTLELFEAVQGFFEQAASRSKTSAYPSWWEYTSATLAKVLGQNTEAQIRFRDALLLPDRMLAYHLTRLADSEPAP